MTEQEVTLYVDDLEIETLPLEPPVGIFINGRTQVGKYVSKGTTVPVRQTLNAERQRDCVHVCVCLQCVPLNVCVGLCVQVCAAKGHFQTLEKSVGLLSWS